MKIVPLSLMALCLTLNLSAQKFYTTKAGQTSFDAGTGLEDIKAVNKSTTSVIDPASGQIQFSLLIKGFEFKSQLMQDHFNENYMESDKFPKSTFKGKISNPEKVNFSKDGSYPVTVTGTLEIHGVKKDISATGTIKVSGESVSASSDFEITLKDYSINIPGVVEDKLSKTAKIKYSGTYAVLNK